MKLDPVILSTSDRIVGGMWGLLVGDAVGVPYEFHAPDRLPPLDQIDVVVPEGFSRAHATAPKGAWSDDGAHALCLAVSVVAHRGVNAKDLITRMSNWLRWGYLAVDGKVFDIGNATHTALKNFESGVDPELCGPCTERSNGNGSLMRVLPLALFHKGSDAALVADAMRQSVVTHGHLRSQLCCALYCLFARNTLLGIDEPWGRSVETMRLLAHGRTDWSAELDTHITPEVPAAGTGTGYVVDCLHSARWALQSPDFATVIRRAVSLGNDTDTTAAVAGGIAGIRCGLAGIPERWLAHIAEQDTATPIIEALAQSRQTD